MRVNCLPGNLDEALRELSQDQVIRSVLGDEIYSRIAQAKSEEWKRFQAFVHPWEMQEYFFTY